MSQDRKHPEDIKRDFDRVAEFHVAAGHPIYDGGYAKLPPVEMVQFRNNFILEEFQEGFKATVSKDSHVGKRIMNALDYIQETMLALTEDDLNDDMVEIADSLGDTIFVAHGAGHCYNIDMPRVFNEISRTGMTRFPHGEDELQDTLDKAQAEGIEVTHVEIPDGRYTVNIASTGKVYKNAHYEKPNLRDIVIDPNK